MWDKSEYEGADPKGKDKYGAAKPAQTAGQAATAKRVKAAKGIEGAANAASDPHARKAGNAMAMGMKMGARYKAAKIDRAQTEAKKTAAGQI